jgi:hypothetical protein
MPWFNRGRKWIANPLGSEGLSSIDFDLEAELVVLSPCLHGPLEPGRQLLLERHQLLGLGACSLGAWESEGLRRLAWGRHLLESPQDLLGHSLSNGEINEMHNIEGRI